MSTAAAVLKATELKVHYPVRKSFLSRGPKRFVRAVDGVTLELRPGETLGLVGESGCGKSSLGRALLRLHEPTSGDLEICGENFLRLGGEQLRKARSRIQMVFQDPYGSLDPRMTVFDILAEPLLAHQKLKPAEVTAKVRKALDQVKLPRRVERRYPHEFSGGQRQRIAIARSLMLDPTVLVADEPVSSLDVSVQAEILNLLREIRQELGLSMIFIAHNLAVVRYISDRIAVMYLGKIVETGASDEIYASPRHPYTQALVSAVPVPDPRLERARRRIPVTGEPPSPTSPPAGCAFAPRCPIAVDRCRLSPPPLEALGSPTHRVACYEAKS